MLAAPDPPFPSSVELVLQRFAPLVDARGASAIGFATITITVKAQGNGATLYLPVIRKP